MKKFSGTLLVLSEALTFIVVLTVADKVSAMAASTGNVSHSTANGKRIFAQFCASCHDAHSTTSRVGIGLQDYYRQHQPHPTDSSVRTIILKGKGAMPGFSILSGSQANDLIEYLRTL
jgi:mono/diheme cytochrome c family protein